MCGIPTTHNSENILHECWGSCHCPWQRSCSNSCLCPFEALAYFLLLRFSWGPAHFTWHIIFSKIKSKHTGLKLLDGIHKWLNISVYKTEEMWPTWYNNLQSTENSNKCAIYYTQLLLKLNNKEWEWKLSPLAFGKDIVIQFSHDVAVNMAWLSIPCK